MSKETSQGRSFYVGATNPDEGRIVDPVYAQEIAILEHPARVAEINLREEVKTSYTAQEREHLKVIDNIENKYPYLKSLQTENGHRLLIVDDAKCWNLSYFYLFSKQGIFSFDCHLIPKEHINMNGVASCLERLEDYRRESDSLEIFNFPAELTVRPEFIKSSQEDGVTVPELTLIRTKIDSSPEKYDIIDSLRERNESNRYMEEKGIERTAEEISGYLFLY